MKKRIDNITSDSTFTSVEIYDRVFKLQVTLYTEDKINIEFMEHWASRLDVEWNGQEMIERLVFTDQSELLDTTRASLKSLNEPSNNLYSFQALNPFEEVLVEVIARSLQIGGIPIELS